MRENSPLPVATGTSPDFKNRSHAGVFFVIFALWVYGLVALHVSP
jgi:hypothetical protein